MGSEMCIRDSLETEAWALYMTEDGLVDEDYPAIDRTLVVGRFGENEFAVCARPYVPKAPPPAAKAARKAQADTMPVAAQPIQLSPAADELGTGVSANRVVLQIMVVPHARGMTTVRVSPNATAQDVIHAVCEQCQLGSARTYALLFRDVDEVVPGERPVRGFVERTDLVLVERTSLPDAPSDTTGLQRRSSKVPEQPKYKTAMDLISNYKVCVHTHRAGLYHQPSAPHFGGPSRASAHDRRRLDSYYVRCPPPANAAALRKSACSTRGRRRIPSRRWCSASSTRACRTCLSWSWSARRNAIRSATTLRRTTAGWPRRLSLKSISCGGHRRHILSLIHI